MSGSGGPAAGGPVPFRGIGAPPPERQDWVGFFVFIGIPILLAWLLTEWTERRVLAMWSRADARQADPAPVPPPPRGDQRPSGPNQGGTRSAEPDPVPDAGLWAEFQEMRATESLVLEELTRLGPAELWDCDPALKVQVLQMLARVTPEVFAEWQRRVSTDPPDDQCQG